MPPVANYSSSPNGESRGEGGRHTIRQLTSNAIAGLLLAIVTGCSNCPVSVPPSSAESSEDVSNSIRTKVSEFDHDKDGIPDSRFETFYRGDAKVLMVYSRVSTNGAMRVSARTYLVNGEIVFSEGDDGGDGIFETCIVTHPDTGDLEDFTRAAEGDVRPASTRTVNAYRKQMSAVAEFFHEMPTMDEFDEKFHAAKQKIDDAEMEKD